MVAVLATASRARKVSHDEAEIWPWLVVLLNARERWKCWHEAHFEEDCAAQDYVDRDRRATIERECDCDWYKADSSSTATEIRWVVGIGLIVRRIVREEALLEGCRLSSSTLACFRRLPALGPTSLHSGQV